MAGSDKGTRSRAVPWAETAGEPVERPRWTEPASSDSGAHPLGSKPGPGSHFAARGSDARAGGRGVFGGAFDGSRGGTHEGHEDGEQTPSSSRDFERELDVMTAEVESLQQQLVTMASSAEHVRRQLLETCEADVVELAVALSERIVGRELTTDTGRIASWAKKALESLAEQRDLLVVVSQDVFDSVPRDAWRDAEGRVFVPRVDAKLARGSCDIRSTVSRIDGSLTARMRTIVESLGVTEER